MTAREALTAALDRALDAGLRIPCAGREEWTSNDLDVLTTAAAECDGCPALAECAAAAEGESWGAWGGQVLTPTWQGGRRRRETKEKTA